LGLGLPTLEKQAKEKLKGTLIKLVIIKLDAKQDEDQGVYDNNYDHRAFHRIWRAQAGKAEL
jgi:hypothetical protein